MKKEHIKHALEAYLPELTAMADQIYDLADEAQAKDFEGAILISRLNHSMRDADARKANCEEFGYTHRVCTRERAARPSGF